MSKWKVVDKAKTIRDVEVGDIVVDENGDEIKVLEVGETSVLLSLTRDHGLAYGWLTFEELERYGYGIKDQETEGDGLEETILELLKHQGERVKILTDESIAKLIVEQIRENYKVERKE